MIKLKGNFMSLRGLQKKSLFLPSISGIDSWHFVKSVKKSTYHVTKLEKVRSLYNVLFESDLCQTVKA